ncbi:ATP-binding protein [Neobacillus sp. D3-1R]|uniref:ATP-binding protein n=1 Tax=Neobacillus sp. D3-1R TaxID=3445778 RepID=UPI003FA17F50
MALKREYKHMFKYLLIYISVTLIPSLIISYFIAHKQVNDWRDTYKDRAQWYANFHSMTIENFLGETIGSLEMLATSIKIQHNNLDEIKSILIETHGKDPRFSGFYWANPNGDLVISTNPTDKIVNVSDRDYFQQALKTKNTAISDAHIGRVTGRYIVTIASPIVIRGQVNGVLLASLRLDKIEENIRSLLKEEKIVVTNQVGQPLMKAGLIEPQNNYIKSSQKITEIPWTITAFIHSDDEMVFRNSFIQDLVIFLTITNIIFLLMKYILLRRKVKKEKELAELQKLELIGNLAASTAHEIRNPLTGIKGLIKLMNEDNHDSKMKYYFDVIQTELDRINTIVSELLVLGKPSVQTLKTCNANDIIAEIEPILYSEANFMNVQLSVHYSPFELSISCVKDHLKQVILNLSKNSLQAMPNGGKLTISLEKWDETCVIKVTDTGDGMPNDTINQVFKPFFTMKKDGSGLGLTVCKRIIDTLGGNITLTSKLNEGTQVEITLPLSKD